MMNFSFFAVLVLRTASRGTASKTLSSLAAEFFLAWLVLLIYQPLKDRSF